MSDLTLSDRFNNMLNCCNTLGDAIEPFERLFTSRESQHLKMFLFKDASYTIVFVKPHQKEIDTIYYFSGKNLFNDEEFIANIVPFIKEHPMYKYEVKDLLTQFAEALSE